MKFGDLFLPKIARSDPKVRLAAVQKEENIELLKQVQEKDDDPQVREAARMRVAEIQD